MREAALTFEDVTRRFGSKTALEGLTLRVEPGTVLGLLGRNGAGKTTTLRLAHGILFPDAGNIRVLGLDPVTRGLAVRTETALLAEESALYPWMTVEQILFFGSALHPRWDAELAGSLTGQLGLVPGERIRTLSRGTRAKVALVLAVASRPRLLLLDDPTAGLDPLVRREILQGILEAVAGEGGAVVYASHLVHDIERVADRIAVLEEGRLDREGSLDAIKQRTRRARAVFEDDAPRKLNLPGRIDWETSGRVLTVVAEGENGELEQGLRALGAKSVEVGPLSLEEILVACLRRGHEEKSDV